jgi:uncharacterized protein YegP (UPF0339 family)
LRGPDQDAPADCCFSEDSNLREVTLAGLSYPCYFAYRHNASRWRWTYYASTMKIIAIGTESYANKDDCLNAIRIMKGSSGSTIYASE